MAREDETAVKRPMLMTQHPESPITTPEKHRLFDSELLLPLSGRPSVFAAAKRTASPFRTRDAMRRGILGPVSDYEVCVCVSGDKASGGADRVVRALSCCVWVWGRAIGPPYCLTFLSNDHLSSG